jgi:serine/threonine protein kinase
MLLKEGELVGGTFEVIGLFARGGMALIYQVRDRFFSRVLALKVLIATRSQEARQVEYFEREAQVLATLRHSGVPAIYAYGELQGHPYVVMDFLEGETLAKRIQRLGTLEPTAVLDICEQVGDVLVTAHQRGIVHRDLKPDNIYLLAGGRRQIVKVLDFGISRVASETGAIATAPGTLLGTPEFMSPEQARGDTTQIGPATDIYALGMIAYVMLAGRPAFPLPPDEPLSPIALINHIARVNQDPPAALGPNIGAATSQVILRALAKQPEDRFPSIAAFLDALREAHRGDATAPTRSGSHVPTGAVTSSSPQLPAELPSPQGRPAARWLALTFACGLLLGGLVVGFGARSTQSRAAAAPPVTAEPLQPRPAASEPAPLQGATRPPAPSPSAPADLPARAAPLPAQPAPAAVTAVPAGAIAPPPAEALAASPKTKAPLAPPATRTNAGPNKPAAPKAATPWQLVLQPALPPALAEVFTESVHALHLCKERGQQVVLTYSGIEYLCIGGCGDSDEAIRHRINSWLTRETKKDISLRPESVTITCQK